MLQSRKMDASGRGARLEDSFGSRTAERAFMAISAWITGMFV
jgi:hypothetical protein